MRHGENSRNLLLNRLPENEQDRIATELTAVDLELRTPLFEAGAPIEHVYFLESGVASVVAARGGGVVEVATVGNEGMIGLPVFLGTNSVPLDAFIQVPGWGYRLTAGAFRALVDRNPQLHAALNRYTQALFFQIAQSSACNRLHPVEQRAARWILMTHDRVDKGAVLLTQEFLAQMLGVRRATVNEAARALEGRGLIAYRRGRIDVLDRPGLEAAACDCYAAIREEYTRLMGPQAAAP